MDSAAEYSTVRPAALGPLGMGASQQSALEQAFGAVLPPHVCEAEALLDTGMETMEVQLQLAALVFEKVLLCVYYVALDFFSSSTFVQEWVVSMRCLCIAYITAVLNHLECGRGGGSSACSLCLSPHVIPSIITYSISFYKNMV